MFASSAYCVKKLPRGACWGYQTVSVFSPGTILYIDSDDNNDAGSNLSFSTKAECFEKIYGVKVLRLNFFLL